MYFAYQHDPDPKGRASAKVGTGFFVKDRA
jgi:hypothetical protein